MNDEDPNRLANHGREDDVMDRKDDVKDREKRTRREAKDRLIYAALVDDVVAAAPVLSEADIAAFQALGTSEEFARKVFAKFQKQCPRRAPERGSTCVNDQAAGETTQEAAREAAAPDPQFEGLLARHRDCHQVEHFDWTSRFVKKKEIGQGGQGVVYLIECTDDAFVGNRALKILSPQPYGSLDLYRRDMQRVRDVAALVHQIYHDNLIYVERFESRKDIYMMVMRLVDGFDLQRLLDPQLIDNLKRTVDERRWRDQLHDAVFAPRGEARWGLAPGVAVSIIQKCLRGLSALHDKGIVHCDIKPSNIMVDCYGSIRLIDIGSAFQIGFRPERPAWTPRYAPPEVLEDRGWTKQGDLASLGYVLIELLSGQTGPMGSLDNSNSAHALDKVTRCELADCKRRLPDRLEEIVPSKALECKSLKELCRKLTDPDPARRFASAEEAFDWTVKFQAELVCARLSLPWVKVIKFLVTDAKRAMASADNSA